ncbi:MAG: response regulator transcription factor [Verrucomicrobia bacterium]|nr:response regulator transcription factor [Verrucomicrobiota bacterium]
MRPEDWQRFESASQMKRTVSIVEDHEGIRNDLALAVRRSRDLELISAYSDAETAVKRLPVERPHVVLLDINLPGLSGLDLLRYARPLLPDALMIMLTIRMDPEAIVTALKAGADGYLLKQSSGRKMMEEVRRAISGETPMSGAVARLVIQSFHMTRSVPAQCALSVREHQVLDELAKGKSHDEIATALTISKNTVSSHLQSCYRKLHANEKLEALRKAGKIT